MRSRRRNGIVVLRILLGAAVLLGLLTPGNSVDGQGRTDYFNVESPQVHPIEVARVHGHDYILAVNTPDNSLEIWDTDESIPVANRFLHRVRVGLEPVSVRWVGERGMAYVVNFLGDSITAISLTATGGPATLNAQVLQTAPVTDEPLDVAFAQVPVGEDTTPTLFITHMTLDAFSAYHAQKLVPVSAGSERMDVSLPSGGDIDFDGELDDIALKEPWTLAVACDRLFILGHKGGNTSFYDFDLYSEDLGGGTQRRLTGLGSTNWNMAFASNDDLFVVGAEAVNTGTFGETAVKDAETGFVESTLYWIQNPCSANPTIRRRDLNEKSLLQQNPNQPTETEVGSTSGGSVSSAMGALVAQPAIGPVAKGQALAQPTDVVPFEVGGVVTKVFLVAYGSDRLGIVEPAAGTAPVQWKRRRVNLPQITGAASMTGPRGLALKTANPEQLSDPGARLYILNRLDQSVTVVDPVAETVVAGASFALQNDPTPPWVHAGRRFLYSAKLSGNGFDSCASCHTDARTDGLAWDLSDGNEADIPPHLIPDPDIDFPGNTPGKFPANKSFMVTQSLQGLLNFEVPPDIQHLFTNAPYHWRGDRETFVAFNPAFVALMGGSELSGPDMDRYEEFINSVSYPPNPKQPFSRILSGELGDPDDDDVTQSVSGSGALRGMKLFHIRNSDGVGACVHCHFLPEGSNNILTEDIAGFNPHPPSAPTPGSRQPIETAALRGLFQKEARLDRDGSSFHDDSPVTGYEGMFHTGLVFPPNISNDFNATATMNAFNLFFFNGRFCQGGQPPFCDNLQSLNQFDHEFDFGVGPVVGKAFSVTSLTAFSIPTGRAFNTAESQAEAANAGAVVQAWIGGTKRGFWYDLTGASAVWREEPSGATFTRAGLLALLSAPDDRLVLLSTPLGSERRVADPSGSPALQTGTAPTITELLPMVTNTAYAEIPALSVFWAAGAGCTPPGCLPERHGGTTPHTVRVLQNALLDNSNGFGLCSVRHEAPRRFRVLAKGLRHGATLHLFIQNDPGGPPPNTALRVDDAGQVATLELVLPLHPTGLQVEGSRVWETAVEMEPMLFYRLMAGPPSVAGILDAVTDIDFLFQITPESMPTNPPGITFSPATWNQHWVRVANTDGTSKDLGWRSLNIEKGPNCP